MKIASWNINSIRKRLELLKELNRKHNIDVVCLQETKVQDSEFPVDAVKEIGFEHIIFNGNKGYNGVAILSKLPFKHLDYKNFIESEARDLSVIINDIEIHNLYVPAGGDIPDPEINQKFMHKLEFFQKFHDWTLTNISSQKQNAIFLGDLNIAPLETDVWSHKQLLKEVSHTPVEIELMKNWYIGNSLIDGPRVFIDETQKLYSWWSYRNRDYKKSNRGRRLDHFFITQKLRDRLSECFYDSEFRSMENPSDHVPLIGSIIL